MKKVITTLSLILVLISCNKEESIAPIIFASTEAKINSYSKNYGYSGETISIFGENFTDKTSDVILKFDEILATIISTSATEIKFVLPVSDKVIPVLNLMITNRYINNLVENTYNKNIGILPKITLNSWIAVENPLKVDRNVNRIQMISYKSVYYTMEGGGTNNVVYRTLDDGVSWQLWSSCGFPWSAFQATLNDDGWASNSGQIIKVPVGGSMFMTPVWNGLDIISINVSNNFKNATCVSSYGLVSKTNDGINFSQDYSSSININNTGNIIGYLNSSYEIDDNHIWAAGFKKVPFTQAGVSKPFLVYKNNAEDGWKESIISQAQSGSSTKSIQFFLNDVGYILLQNTSNTDSRIFKSVNGGNSWTSTGNVENFTNFTFKSENIGWAILDNKIYKTIDGGTSWQIDFTHDQNLRNIAYKDNVVWAISKDKILKYYIQ